MFNKRNQFNKMMYMLWVSLTCWLKYLNKIRSHLDSILVINNLVPFYSFRRIYMSSCLFLFCRSHLIRKLLPHDHLFAFMTFLPVHPVRIIIGKTVGQHMLGYVLFSINFSSYLQRETAQMHRSEQWQLFPH